MNDADLPRVLADLLRLDHETEWVEFKLNNSDELGIGEYISAIANSAALHNRNEGYIVWGVADADRRLVGTTFQPRSHRIGNQPLEIWLAHQLEPGVHFTIHEGEVLGVRAVVFCIPAASASPVAFKGVEYIRVGEAKALLRNHPAKARALWAAFDRTPFEKRGVGDGFDADEVLRLLDYPSYFELMNQPLPDNRAGILEHLGADGLVRQEPGGYVITNVAAILFARELEKLERLARKAIRVIVYRDNDRSTIVRQQTGHRGYAPGFEGLIGWVNAQLPQNEHIGQALRKTVPMYPEIAIREIVANALIHQDLTIIGAGPLVEIFPNRVEVTNPGRPLIEPLRFLDLPPRSRNEHLASLMRRMGMCEELGSGIDRVLAAIEMFQLPAPQFTAEGDSTRVTLFAPRAFADMDRADRVRACYQHAGLKYLIGERMTNATLRQRFGIREENYSQVSRVIADAVRAAFIRPDPPDATARRHAKYVPYWAASEPTPI
jgi:ATP-dependent DNA helicase RecG